MPPFLFVSEMAGKDLPFRGSCKFFKSQWSNYEIATDLVKKEKPIRIGCLLYTSDAADDMQCVDLGGRRIIKKTA